MKKSKIRLSENQWLSLLEEAIQEGVKIQTNYRFTYKGKSLGYFLYSAKRKNKVDLIKKIENLGIDLNLHSRDAETYVKNFIKQLRKDKNPIKQVYCTRFNSYVLPKKKKIDEQIVFELNRVWKTKFNEVRKWTKKTREQKVIEWKKFRYNEYKNPEEKWFKGKTHLGSLYSWVYSRKNSETKMKLILHCFNEQEIKELKEQGFPI